MRFCAGGSRVGVRAPSPIFLSIEKRMLKNETSFHCLRSLTCGHRKSSEMKSVNVKV